jgi:integrase
MKSIRPRAEFFAAINQLQGIAARALEVTLLTGLRTGEVIGARWSEIDLEHKTWAIPPERLKDRRTQTEPHGVPLTPRVIAILKALPKLGGFVFPGLKPGKPLSNMARLSVLKDMNCDESGEPRTPSRQNSRADIPEVEWRTLYTYLRRYVKEAQDKRRYRERYYLQHYILILANSGIRVGEARHLRWRDISSTKTLSGQKRLIFTVRSKIGDREVVCNETVERYVERLRNFRSEEVKNVKPSKNRFSVILTVDPSEGVLQVVASACRLL